MIGFRVLLRLSTGLRTRTLSLQAESIEWVKILARPFTVLCIGIVVQDILSHNVNRVGWVTNCLGSSAEHHATTCDCNVLQSRSSTLCRCYSKCAMSGLRCSSFQHQVLKLTALSNRGNGLSHQLRQRDFGKSKHCFRPVNSHRRQRLRTPESACENGSVLRI